MRVFVTGATGLIGERLCRELATGGYEVVALSRKPGEDEGIEWVQGDATGPGAWQRALDGCDAVIHLAGESVAGSRWSAARKRLLVASRVETTNHVVDAIAAAKSPPRSLVSASAVGFYGPRGDTLLREDAAPGTDFLARLCVDWEAAAAGAQRHGVRVVCLRFGVVLSKRGGALATLRAPYRLGLGGAIGSKGNWFPWVHDDDAVGLTRHALEGGWAGPVNVVSPAVVTMGEFARELGRAVHRPVLGQIPLPLARLVLGEFAHSISPGQKVHPAVAERVGYVFSKALLRDALAECIAG